MMVPVGFFVVVIAFNEGIEEYCANALASGRVRKKSLWIRIPEWIGSFSVCHHR